MTLRRKLLTLLASLATTALLLVVAGFWATSTQKAAHGELEDHLLKSLLLQRIDASGRVLLRGQFAAVVAETPRARERFDALEQGVREDLARWSAISTGGEDEGAEDPLTEAFDKAMSEIRATLELLDRGEQEEALEQLLDYDRRQPFGEFRDATTARLEASVLERTAIRRKLERSHGTVQIGLSIAAVAVLSLVMLFGAYLAGEVFKPLHDLNEALEAATRGDRRTRLDEARDDELGSVSRGFNRLMDALDDAPSGADGPGVRGLEGVRAELQRRVVALESLIHERSGEEDPAEQEITARLRQVAETLGRAFRFAAPTNLSMSRLHLAHLAHDVMASFGATFAARSIGVEVWVDPEVDQIIADPPKLRAALIEIVRSSLDALPERGGRIGLRALPDPDDEGHVLIEIADDGPGGDPRRYERALATKPDDLDEGADSLSLSYDVIVSHGGRVEVDANPGKSTRTLIRLPIE